MISSNKCYTEVYGLEKLRKISTVQRLKAFRVELYKRDIFWCCEFNCARVKDIHGDGDTKMYDNWQRNLNNVNKVLAEKTANK